MRSLTFRIIIAFAAFGVGTFISLSLYQQSAKYSAYEQINKESLAINQNFKANELQASEVICEDKTIRLVWDEVKKDLLGWRDIEPGTSCADYLNIDQVIDLNSDGKNEI